MLKFSAFLLVAATLAKMEYLANKYKLDMSVIEHLNELDPTHGVYLEWLARETAKGNPIEDSITASLNEFEKVKRNPEWRGAKDILSYSFDRFIGLIEQLSREDYSKKQKVRDIEENAKKYITEGVEYLGKVGKYYCYQPTTVMALVAMSQGTHWCTGSEAHASGYMQRGQTYVFTEPDYYNSYGNDKYALMAVQGEPDNDAGDSAGLTHLEIENAAGKDMSSTEVPGKVYTEEAMEFVKFVAQFNAVLRDNLDDIYEGTSGWQCAGCGEHQDEDDSSYGSDGDLCEECYHDTYTTCESCGTELDRENDIYNTTENGETLCGDCSVYCEKCDTTYSNRGRGGMRFYEVSDETFEVCSNCFQKHYFECETCGDGTPDDDNNDYDGDSYCSECYKKLCTKHAKTILNDWSENFRAEIIDDVIASILYLNKRGPSFNPNETEWLQRKEKMESDPVKFVINELSSEFIADNDLEVPDEDAVMEWLTDNLYATESGDYIPGQVWGVK